MRQVALTTLDNPYNPWTQFNEWYAFDIAKGYDSCGLLARLANTSIDMSDVESTKEIEDAIDRIVNMNCFGDYRKLIKET